MRLFRLSGAARRTLLVAALGVACGLLLAHDSKKSSSAAPGSGAPEAKSPPAPGEGGILSRLLAAEQKARKALPIERKFAEAIRKSDLAAAQKVCEQWVAELPEAPEGHYNLACVLALRGQSQPAFRSLSGRSCWALATRPICRPIPIW